MERKFLTTKEAAEYLSCKIGYFYHLVKQNRFKFYKPEKSKAYFTKEDLDSYITGKQLNGDQNV